MDKNTHELIKTYIKENEGTGTVYITAPNAWIEASRLNCWISQ